MATTTYFFLLSFPQDVGPQETAIKRRKYANSRTRLLIFASSRSSVTRDTSLQRKSICHQRHILALQRKRRSRSIWLVRSRQRASPPVARWCAPPSTPACTAFLFPTRWARFGITPGSLRTFRCGARCPLPCNALLVYIWGGLLKRQRECKYRKLARKNGTTLPLKQRDT